MSIEQQRNSASPQSSSPTATHYVAVQESGQPTSGATAAAAATSAPSRAIVAAAARKFAAAGGESRSRRGAGGDEPAETEMRLLSAINTAAGNDTSAPLTCAERLEVAQLKLRVIVFGPICDICANLVKFCCLTVDGDLLPSRRKRLQEAARAAEVAKVAAERKAKYEENRQRSSSVISNSTKKSEKDVIQPSKPQQHDGDVFGGTSSAVRFDTLEAARVHANLDDEGLAVARGIDVWPSASNNSSDSASSSPLVVNPEDAAAAAVTRMQTTDGAQADLLAAIQQNHLLWPLSIVDVIVMISALLNCILLALYHPVAPHDIVARYVTMALAGINASSPSYANSSRNDNSSMNTVAEYAHSDTNILIGASDAVIIVFDRPSWVTAIEYAAICIFSVEVLLRWSAFGRRWMLQSAFRILDIIITIASFVALCLEVSGAAPAPSRLLGISALKLISLPSILFRARFFPSGMAEMFESLGGAAKRSWPAFAFYFSFVTAFALIFLALLRGEMKDRCVRSDWLNVSECFTSLDESPAVASSTRFSTAAFFAAHNTTGTMPSYCVPHQNEALANLLQYNLSYVFLAERKNFVCGATFESTVLGMPARVACSPQQVCVAQKTIGTETTGYRCPWGYRCAEVENLYEGAVGFDNYLAALFSTFVASSEKLWYILGPSAADSSMDAFFFIFVVFIILSVVVLNVTIATLCTEYERCLAIAPIRADDNTKKHNSCNISGDQEQRESTTATTSSASPQAQGPLGASSADSALFSSSEENAAAAAAALIDSRSDGGSGEHRNDNDNNSNKNNNNSVNNNKTPTFFESMHSIVEANVAFAFFSVITAIAHILVFTVFTQDSSRAVLDFINTADHIFLSVLVAETACRVVGTGPREYFLRRASGMTDTIVVVVAVAGFALFPDYTTYDARMFRSIRVMRAVRAFSAYYRVIQGWLQTRFGLRPWLIPARWFRALRRSAVASALLVSVIITGVTVSSISMEHAGGGLMCKMRVRLELLHGGAAGAASAFAASLPHHDETRSNATTAATTLSNNESAIEEQLNDTERLSKFLSDNIQVNCVSANHESFGEAVLTIWQVISGDDWELLTYDAMLNLGKGYAIVYVGIFVLGFLVVISVFASSILAAYLAEAEVDMETARDRAEKEKMREMQLLEEENAKEMKRQMLQQMNAMSASRRDEFAFATQDRDGRDLALVGEMNLMKLRRETAGKLTSAAAAAESAAPPAHRSTNGVFGDDDDDGPPGDLHFEEDGAEGGTAGSSDVFGASGMSDSVAIFNRIEEQNAGRTRCAAYKLRADRLLRRSAIADLGRSVESVRLLSLLDERRAAQRKNQRSDDDQQWLSEVEPVAESQWQMLDGDDELFTSQPGVFSGSSSPMEDGASRAVEMRMITAIAHRSSSSSPTATVSSSSSNTGVGMRRSLLHGQQAGGEDVVPLTASEACWHRFSLLCRDLADSRGFSVFFGMVTAMYVVAQFLFDPTRAPDRVLSRVEYVLDVSSRLLCVLELAVHLIAFGADFRSPTNFWRRSVWNVAECTITSIGLLGLVLRTAVLSSRSNPIIQVIEALFAFRPIVMVRHSVTMQIVIRSLFRATKDLLETTVGILVLCFLYGMVGTQLFAGWMRVCTLDAGRGDVRRDLSLAACEKMGGEWKNPSAHFDTVLQSFFSVFIMTSHEMWAVLMRNTMNFQGPGLPPERSAHFYACIYFVFYSLVSFVVTNIFTAVLVEAYNRCKRSTAAQLSLQTIREHNAWIRSERRMLHVLPIVAQTVLLGDRKSSSKERSLDKVNGDSYKNNNNNQSEDLKSPGSSQLDLSASARQRNSVKSLAGSESPGVSRYGLASASSPLESDGGEALTSDSYTSPRNSDMSNISSSSNNKSSSTDAGSASSSSFSLSSCFLNFRHFLSQMTSHRHWKFVNHVITIWCLLPLLSTVHPRPDWVSTFLNWNEWFLCGLFWAEMLTLLVSSGPRVYIRNAWNRIDCCAALISVVMLGCRLGLDNFPTKYRSIAWFLRLVRIIYMAKGTWFRSTFVRYVGTLQSLSGVLALMVVFFLAFSSIANRLFGRVLWGPVGTNRPNHQNTFRGVFLSSFFLLRLSLGGTWPDVWFNLRNKAAGCDLNIGDCGPPTPVPEVFFIVFIVIFSFILKNLLVAVAVDVFRSSGDYRSLQKVDAQITATLWMITQAGREVTVPVQLRVLYTQRVPLNAKILRFLRSLPIGFPTSPLWTREALTEDDGIANHINNSNNNDNEAERNAGGGAGAAKNSNIKTAARTNDSNDSEDNSAPTQTSSSSSSSSPSPLFFKKRGLLEPSIMLRVIEILFVAHQVRTRRLQAAREELERQLRERSSSTFSLTSKVTAAAASLLVSSGGHSAQTMITTTSPQTAASPTTSQTTTPSTTRTTTPAAQSAATTASSVSSAAEVTATASSSTHMPIGAPARSSPSRRLSAAQSRLESIELEVQKSSTPVTPLRGGGDATSDATNFASTENETDEETQKRLKREEMQRRLAEAESESSSSSSGTGSTNGTSLNNSPDHAGVAPTTAAASAPPVPPTQQQQRKRGVTFSGPVEPRENPSSAPPAAASALRSAIRSSSMIDHAKSAAPNAASDAPAAVPAAVPATAAASAAPFTAPLPPPSDAMCSFAEICDVLFHMSFTCAFAPSSADRVFNCIDMRDLRLNATQQDWDMAQEFAFNLWLAEQVGHVWVRRVMLRRSKRKLLEVNQPQQQAQKQHQTQPKR